MTKPMKPKTSGLSAGPTAYWDSRSDAIKNAKIKQLSEEIKRLRELLRECQPYVEAGLSGCDTRLCDAIEKEVGDE